MFGLFQLSAGNLNERVEQIGAGGFAGVACWSPQEYCFSALLPRTTKDEKPISLGIFLLNIFEIEVLIKLKAGVFV